jgi:beta-lactamase class A
MKTIYILILTLISFVKLTSYAQLTTIKPKIDSILQHKRATVAVSVYDLQTKEYFEFNEAEELPMQSVYKYHLGLTVLHFIDKGLLSFEQKIKISKKELQTDLYSPIREKYPEGVELPLSEILEYTIGESDNVGCDLLFRLIGGPKVVEDYVESLGITACSIKNTEEEIQKKWEVQFDNWSTSRAMVDVLKKFYTEKTLTKKSYQFLYKTMLESPTGKNRLVAHLPAGAKIAHKTGTSGTKDGIMAAVNDAGIVTKPNGSEYIICVFVSNSKETIEVNELIIADISKIVYDNIK